ncbi:MAG: thioester reductase domain-containing protein [Polyangiaceae bacterium]|nr:thioester reductase domain-containing protein [Polyangiaceae bacterium]
MTDIEHAGGVAIIGLAGRFPGANDLATFWANLRAGVESITFFDRIRLENEALDRKALEHPGYVNAGAVLEGADLFDAPFFGLSPREAELTDPQHRLLLECAWHALENAGYDPTTHRGPIGVYAGAAFSGYTLLLEAAGDGSLGGTLGGMLQHMLGNERDYLCTRISYKLNLRGPSVNVQSACSTSLLAIHLACQALLNGECDMALAGGVAFRITQGEGYVHEPGLTSPDGHCRAFDASAGGTLFGNGVGLVVLKRLEDALADGDTIRAVVRGSAINNDGSAKVGYTAPSVLGQATVITEALASAGIDADSVGLIEAHGTATPLGDPIEVAALTRAFRAHTARRNYCALGSLKTNLGHLETAAGVASLIKAVFALEHRELPPSLHYTAPNPEIDFASSPFYVNDRLQPWPGPGPRRAGVSAFGFGGTNAHVVLEEAPPAKPSGPSRPAQLLVLSARTRSALEANTRALADDLERCPERPLADVAHTLRVGRQAMAWRRYVVCRDRAEAVEALRGDDARLHTRERDEKERSVVFLFPGGGAQYRGMGRGLYECEPAFREGLSACAERLRPLWGGHDLAGLLYDEADEARLVRPSTALPALFATEYALARLWESWGVRPQAMIGHSVGEYAAACLAGVFSLDDALALVALRGRLFERVPPGGMVSVPLPEAEIAPLLGPDLSLAAVNGPALCAVSGPERALDAFARSLADRGVQAQRIHIDIAAHSALIDPILDEFQTFLRGLTLRAPELPFVSNVTGTWITPQEAQNPDYWVAQLRQTVRFEQGLRTLLEDPHRVLIEVGPGRSLGTFARQHRAAAPRVLASLRHPHDEQSDVAFLLDSLGHLFAGGGRVDWSGFVAHEQRRRVPLPGYAFDHKRYWPNVSALRQANTSPAAAPLPLAGAAAAAAPKPADGHARPDTGVPYVEPSSELERELAALWERLLGVRPVGRHDNFFNLGGHSLLATQLTARVRAQYGVTLPLRALFAAPNLGALARAVAAAREGAALPDAAIDLAAEAKLDEGISPRGLAAPATSPPRRVLLTGATGFVGAFLLRELLRRTDTTVVCLARAASDDDAARRLRDNLAHYRLWEPAFAARVEPLSGDLATPRLGLSDEAFGRLADRVDAIYHCGALVNFARDYTSLRAPNVHGTHEALRLATTARLKPLHFLSSAGIFTAPAYANVERLYEDEPLADGRGLHSGYAESKWVAEHLLAEARRRGVPLTVFRTATVGGDSRTGAGNSSDFTLRFVKACVQLGKAPELDVPAYLSPVDWVAAALVHLSLAPASLGHCFHLVPERPTRLPELMQFVRRLGYELAPLPYAAWRREALAAAHASVDNALHPFAHLLESESLLRVPLLDDANARAGLAGASLPCPPMTLPLARLYFDHLVATGFMPPPPRAAATP